MGDKQGASASETRIATGLSPVRTAWPAKKRAVRPAGTREALPGTKIAGLFAPRNNLSIVSS